MNGNSPAAFGELLEGLKHNTGWAVGTGILTLIVGVAALVAPLASGLAITVMVGVLLVIGGIGQCVLAFRAGAFGRGLLIFLTGLVALVVGAYFLTQPVAALASLTLLLAAYFVVIGVIAIIEAIALRAAPRWGWMLAHGVVTLLLGLLIWRQWPLSGAWAIGVLVGIQLIMHGVSLITIGTAVRGMLKHASAAHAA